MRMFHSVARENWSAPCSHFLIKMSLQILLLAKISRTFTLGKNSWEIQARATLLTDCGKSRGVSRIARGIFSVLLSTFA